MHSSSVFWAVSTAAHNAWQLYDHIVHNAGSRPVPQVGRSCHWFAAGILGRGCASRPQTCCGHRLSQRGCGAGGLDGEEVLVIHCPGTIKIPSEVWGCAGGGLETCLFVGLKTQRDPTVAVMNCIFIQVRTLTFTRMFRRV